MSYLRGIKKRKSKEHVSRSHKIIVIIVFSHLDIKLYLINQFNNIFCKKYIKYNYIFSKVKYFNIYLSFMLFLCQLNQP